MQLYTRMSCMTNSRFLQSGRVHGACPVCKPMHPQVNLLWRPSTYDYGTGIVPNKGPGWQNYLAEDEVRTFAAPGTR